MSEEQKYKRVYVFAIIAILLALIAYSSAQIISSNVFEIVVDNTDLYLSSRVTNSNYVNTDYPIALTVIFHVLGTGASQTVDTNLTVNGTVVIDTDFRTTAGVGLHEHFTTYFIIPRNSTYSITNSSNVHDIEWREYPILSGNNDTIGINQTIITGGNFTFQNDTSVNDYDLTNISNAYVRNIHNYIDNAHIHMNESGNSILISKNSTSALAYLILNGISKLTIISNLDGTRTDIEQYTSQILFKKNSIEKMALNSSGNITMNTTLDMQNYSIINTNFISSGVYTGDGTTNRFIPYSLNRTAAKIDINSNVTPILMGNIIYPGTIFSYKDGTGVSVTSHNSTGFFVSGIYNQLGGINSSQIGSTTNHGSPSTGNIYYFQFTSSVIGTSINISVNSFSANGNARFAIYNDTGITTPYKLLNESGSLALVTGWTNTSLIVPISQGIYWLAMQTSSATEDVYYCTICGNQRNQIQAYGAFPSTATSTAGGAVIWNMGINISISPTQYNWVAI